MKHAAAQILQAGMIRDLRESNSQSAHGQHGIIITSALMAFGIYISVPFCKSKCSYCNFASDVFSRERMQGYVDRVCCDLMEAEHRAQIAGGKLDRIVDTIYLGGGTPSILEAAQIEQMFRALRQEFTVTPGAEITVECAPGTLDPAILDALLRCGVNRISLGVQSFVDQEARSVGRLHTREKTLEDIKRLRLTGIDNINVDLIAGLPHQTGESWDESLTIAIESGAPHVSVYLLEVDEDSRLGRELLAGGARYHVHFVPDDDRMTGFYTRAVERLNAEGIAQYEISNFARSEMESRHNLKYWRRQPYLGFGVDAHSMLPSTAPEFEAVRLAAPDSLEGYMQKQDAALAGYAVTPISTKEAWEETFFLGLRMNRGVNLRDVAKNFGESEAERARTIVQELVGLQLTEVDGDSIRLTLNGRLISNEVFQLFLTEPEVLQERTALRIHLGS